MRNMHKLWCVIAAACILTAVPAAQAQQPQAQQPATRMYGTLPEKPPVCRAGPAQVVTIFKTVVYADGRVGREPVVINLPAVAPAAPQLPFDNPGRPARRPTCTADLRPHDEYAFTKSLYTDCGVPFELAPWIIEQSTSGVPFFPPPACTPTQAGAHEVAVGRAWNGMIGGVNGVPNDDTAPRGTLLIGKVMRGYEGYSLTFSDGPQVEQVQPPQRLLQSAPRPLASGATGATGGVCQPPLGLGTDFPVVLPQEAAARRDKRGFPIVLAQERPLAVARR